MDRTLARTIAAEAQEALDEVAARHGLTATISGGKYDTAAGTFSPKVIFKSAVSDQINFSLDAAAFGVPASLYGARFQSRQTWFTVTGLNLRAPRYPLQAISDDGRRMKFTQAMLDKLVREGATA